MTQSLLYALTSVALVAIGLYGMLARADLLRKIVAFNVVGSGVFLVFGAFSARDPGGGPDPVPHAMVITGIVVAVSATALALTLAWRIRQETGRTSLPEEPEEPDRTENTV